MLVILFCCSRTLTSCFAKVFTILSCPSFAAFLISITSCLSSRWRAIFSLSISRSFFLISLPCCFATSLMSCSFLPKIRIFLPPPSLDQPPSSKREVAESSFDLLHHAIVDKISSSNRNHPEKDLEMIGYTVGQKLVERYVKEKPILENDLAVITFLCKDFWTEVYGKQVLLP
mmetsp:Transcript_47477/g.148490  ORF Transcript_47477/g.148490 Transcript_47477/m.148490 type:complete len:173 (-) Transcript_47477:997-1515(-)